MSDNRGLVGVNEACFRELARLEALSIDNPQALLAETERAKAVKSLAETVISNGRLVLDASRAETATGEAVKIPKGLLS